MKTSVLMLLFYTESPMVVVLSGSMEPSMYRGDILVLIKYDGDLGMKNLDELLEARNIHISEALSLGIKGLVLIGLVQKREEN